jgi:hypothetical protein
VGGGEVMNVGCHAEGAGARLEVCVALSAVGICCGSEMQGPGVLCVTRATRRSRRILYWVMRSGGVATEASGIGHTSATPKAWSPTRGPNQGNMAKLAALAEDRMRRRHGPR